MKWLILASDVKNKDLSYFENLIESHGEKFEEFFINPDVNSKLNPEELQQCMALIGQTSHCIILEGDKLQWCKDYIFLIGLMVGSSVNVFIHTPESYEIKYENLNFNHNSYIKCFDTVSELQKELSADFEDYKKKFNELYSLKELMLQGIPFTADSFAFYVSKDNVEICDKFYSAGIDTNAFTSEGVPFLCVATRNDCTEMVNWLLEKGADINIISKDRGYSPVMDAVWRKNFDIVKLFIEKGADLNIVSSDGQPILVLAVGNGNAKIVELLLANGANAEIPDSMGMSARAYANLFKKAEIVEIFNRYPAK